MSQPEINKKILEYLGKYNPKKIAIFGSYARNEQRADSDIDILINFTDTLSLLQLVHIELELSEILGIKVDLVTERSLKHPKLKEYIQKDIQVIYE